jgi:hypothetical protein
MLLILTFHRVHRCYTGNDGAVYSRDAAARLVGRGRARYAPGSAPR